MSYGVLRTEAHSARNRTAAKDGHEFGRLDGMERAVCLNLLHVLPDLLDQPAEFITGEMIEERAAGGQVVQGLPDRVERRDGIGPRPPPIGRGGTEGISQRRKDRMLTRVLAVEQGAEQVSVHTSTTEEMESCATRRE